MVMPFERGPRLPPRLRGEQNEAAPKSPEQGYARREVDAQDSGRNEAAEQQARLRRMEENEARKAQSQTRAAELMASLRSRSDVADVPGASNVVQFRESPGYVAMQRSDETRAASESLRATETQIAEAELARQGQERIAAEAYRLAQKERAELERLGYETRNFDLRGAVARNTEKLKRQAAQLEAQREGKYAV